MAPPRYLSLDVVRGIAIFGTLGTNVWIFTDPEGLIGYLKGSPESGWRTVELGLQALTQGKFLGLLTVMFGIGLALQQRSAQRRGLPWPGTYPWRAALLLLDGIVHFVLMTEFDVLMGYAVTGWVVAYLLVTSPQVQRRLIAVAAAVHVGLLVLVTYALAAWAPAQPAAPLNPNPYADGSWWDLVLFRVDNAVLFRAETLLIFPMSVALFLLGARLFEAGVLEEHGARLRRRLMTVGFVIALPADVALEMLNPLGIGLLASRYGTAPVVALGILAAVAQFYLRAPARSPGPVGRRLAEVGRMALSSYVLQNLVASIICYGWGLGLAAAVPAQHRVPATVGVFVVVIAVVTTFAHLWLRRFDRGPVEWLWNTSYRTLSRRVTV
ncbi:MAG: putative rane protein [Mycobacterium sp.]|nr:putative rane protein [Mycobacterium sp.]